MTAGKTVVWISGASFGIGAGLARKVPWPDARIINLDIKPSPLYETVTFDLTQPDTWDAVRLHLEAEFATFRKQGVTRAIFMVVGHVDLGSGLAAKIAAQDYRTALIANAVGPLALANDFLRCVAAHEAAGNDKIETGLMLMSSGAAHAKLVGQSAYGAAKAGIEHWVRVMDRELDETGRKTWVVAVRPGLVGHTSRARRHAHGPGHLSARTEDDQAAGPLWCHRRRSGRTHLEGAAAEAGRDADFI